MNVRKASREEWSALFDADPSATFFHSPEWFDVWGKYQGYEPVSLLFEWPDGDVAILPLARERKYWGLRVWMHSSPAVNYGGILCRKHLSDAKLGEICHYLTTLGRMVLRENPYSENRLPFLKTKKDESLCIFLEGRDIASVFNSWDRSHRKNYRTALRSSLSIDYSNKREDWHMFYELYRKESRGRGEAMTVFHQEKLFNVLHKLQETLCKLWLVRQSGEIRAGCIVFYHKSRAICWLSASDWEYLALRPYEFLYFHIIENALNSGLSLVDLNPSAGLEGVIRFKKGLGATAQSSNVYVG